MEPKYIERSKAFRAFLASHKAEVVNNYHLPEGGSLEVWRIQGFEIMFRVEKGGSWTAFVPASQSQEPARLLEGIALFLGEGRRNDLESLAEIGNLARAFLDSLEALPTCTGKDCEDPACMKTRVLQEGVRDFLARLFPTKAADLQASSHASRGDREDPLRGIFPGRWP